jgi:hypothetical protein
MGTAVGRPGALLEQVLALLSVLGLNMAMIAIAVFWLIHGRAC